MKLKSARNVMYYLVLWNMITKFLFETMALMVEDIATLKLTFPDCRFSWPKLITVTNTSLKQYIHKSANFWTGFRWKA